MTERPALPDEIETLNALIDHAMAADRHRLRRRLRAITRSRRNGEAIDLSRQKLRKDAQASAERRAARSAGVPNVELKPDLPITQRADEIAGAVRDHQVVVVAGETGSGAIITPATTRTPACPA